MTNPTRYDTEIGLPTRGHNTEIAIFHINLNAVFPCDSSCTSYEYQNESFFCIKPRLNKHMPQNRLSCVTLNIKIQNISNNLLNIQPKNFIAFDQEGYQHSGQELCEHHNNKYLALSDGYQLYPDGKVQFTLCFTELSADEKICRLVYNCREQSPSPIGIGKLLTTIETFDLILTE